jgi:anti-anti-sigma factor
MVWIAFAHDQANGTSRESAMSIRIEHAGDVAVVITEGRFIVENQVDELEAALAGLMADDGSKKLLLDLSGMEFLRSISIGVIANAHGDAMERGIEFCLCGMDKRNRSVFDLMRLGPELKVFDTRDEALEALRGA